MKLLEEKAAQQITVIVGGIIPKEDAVLLKDCGVAEVFGPGAQLGEISAFIKKRFSEEN
jgi:methylmalonyl-CoA mutase C-terminal domain/subunit